MAPLVDDHHGVQQCESVLSLCWKQEEVGGCDGPTPSTAEVVGEHRFLCGVSFDFDVTAISISFGQKKYYVRQVESS